VKKLIVFFFFLFTGIAVNFLPVQTNFLPYIGNMDASTYIDMSKGIELEGLSEFRFLDFALGALNWFSLPFLLYAIDIESGYWRMMLINTVILFCIVVQLFRLAKHTSLSGALFTIICMLSMPFLWCWIFIPSKENFAVLGFLLLFNYYLHPKQGKTYLPAIFLGLFKTQVIAGFVTNEVLSRVRAHYFLFSLLIINLVTIVVYKVFEEALSVELYLSHQNTNINTSGIILFVEKIIKIPFLGILAVLMRLVLYIPAGVVTLKDAFNTFEGFLMNYSSVIAGILSTIFLFHLKKIRENELRIFWSLLVAFLFVPFVQFRYFWWTIPIFLFFIFREYESGQPEPLQEKLPTELELQLT
jgi:hypothetical protein